MAGAGYKLFATGDVLSASDVNLYLQQQTVMVFASAAARTTALASVLAEGMVSYLKDTDLVEIYTGAAWVSLDDPNAIQNSIVDAKGDIITATADNTPARLAVGVTNGMTLQVDSTAATGLKWATPAAAASGLTLIKRATTSGAANTGTTYDGVFTSTYKAYKIIIESWISTAAGDDPLFQLRYAGPTTQAADYYGSNALIGRDNVWIYNPTVNGTALIMSENIGDTWGSHYEMTVTQVGNTSEKASAFYIGNRQANQSTIIGTLYVDTSRTYTGFILSTASNLTVTASVYGLAI
jgi:hypothetical protein